MSQTTFENTRRALKEFDATQPVRDRAWSRIFTVGDIDAADARDFEAANAVREAFYEDTKTYNGREDCMRLAVSDIKRVVGHISKPSVEPQSE